MNWPELSAVQYMQSNNDNGSTRKCSMEVNKNLLNREAIDVSV